MNFPSTPSENVLKNDRIQIFTKTRIIALTGHNNDVYSAVYRPEAIAQIYGYWQ